MYILNLIYDPVNIFVFNFDRKNKESYGYDALLPLELYLSLPIVFGVKMYLPNPDLVGVVSEKCRNDVKFVLDKLKITLKPNKDSPHSRSFMTPYKTWPLQSKF